MVHVILVGTMFESWSGKGKFWYRPNVYPIFIKAYHMMYNCKYEQKMELKIKGKKKIPAFLS